MNLDNAIKQRRSIRKFTSYYVTDEQLNEAMQAVRFAPSWANTQCWHFIAIRDKGLMKQLVEECYAKNPASKASLTSSLILVACYDTTKSGFYKGNSWNNVGTWAMFDLGMACQNLSLKLHEMGLGSVIVGSYDNKRAAEILNISGDIQIAAIIPVGQPAQQPVAPKRKEVSEFLHLNKYSK